MHRKILATLAISALALTAAGCAETTTTPTPGAEGTPPAEGAPATPGAPAGEATPAEGETAAPGGEAATPGGEAAAPADMEQHNANALAAIVAAAESAGGVAYEIDDADGDGQWEVDVQVGNRSHEVTVAADGTVLGTEESDMDAEDNNRLAQAQITLQQAIERALQEVPGNLDDVELDQENDLDVWEVTIDEPNNDGVEVYIDASSGEVVRVDR